MKLSCTRKRNQALTLVEALVVIVILAIFAAMLMPASRNGKKP